jgi:hypothetical protein
MIQIILREFILKNLKIITIIKSYKSLFEFIVNYQRFHRMSINKFITGKGYNGHIVNF